MNHGYNLQNLNEPGFCQLCSLFTSGGFTSGGFTSGGFTSGGFINQRNELEK